MPFWRGAPAVWGWRSVLSFGVANAPWAWSRVVVAGTRSDHRVGRLGVRLERRRTRCRHGGDALPQRFQRWAQLHLRRATEPVVVHDKEAAGDRRRRCEDENRSTRIGVRQFPRASRSRAVRPMCGIAAVSSFVGSSGALGDKSPGRQSGVIHHSRPRAPSAPARHGLKR
jgi:hypothetical protein